MPVSAWTRETRGSEVGAWHIDAVFRPGGAGPLRRRGGYAGGLCAIAIGLAASRSIATGQAVNVSDFGFPLG